MKAWVKRTLLVLCILVGLPIAELLREEVMYLYISHNLQVASGQIQKGMTKQDVKSIVGEPDWMRTGFNEDIWYWDATNHQGALWKRLGLAPVKGHYQLVARFGDDGKLTDKWTGVN